MEILMPLKSIGVVTNETNKYSNVFYYYNLIFILILEEIYDVYLPRCFCQYHQHTAYIHALTKSVEAYNRQINEGAFLLFSFHGIPKAQANKGDPYEQQCQATAERVAHALALEKDQWRISFQSRFGPAQWLKPYTSDVMATLPGQGKKNLLVICPGFAVDIVDKIGAGDALLAVLSICLYSEMEGELALFISSLAAAQSVESIGNSKPVNKIELLKTLSHSLK